MYRTYGHNNLTNDLLSFASPRALSIGVYALGRRRVESDLREPDRWSFFAMIRIVLDVLFGQSKRTASQFGAPSADTPNRYHRRLYGPKGDTSRIAIVRLRDPLRRLVGRGLSASQFLEREVALSPRGRINVYLLRYWGSGRQREALWARRVGRVVAAHISRVASAILPCGHCEVHLTPD